MDEHINDLEARVRALEYGPLRLLSSDPPAPDDGTWWGVIEGTSPTQVSIKARVNGATVVVAAITQ
jgi:hypothetical protein